MQIGQCSIRATNTKKSKNKNNKNNRVLLCTCVSVYPEGILEKFSGKIIKVAYKKKY